MADPQDPSAAEGPRPSDGAKNPEQEAQHPGGRPTDKVKGSAPAHPKDPEGQQGATPPAQRQDY